jgi:hypothetical protein
MRRGILRRVWLHSLIRLFKVDGELASLPEHGVLSYKLDTRIEVQQIEDEAVIVDGDYELLVRSGSVDDEDSVAEKPQDQDPDETTVRIAFKLAGLYSIDDREPDIKFSDEELDAFGQTTGQLALYPYAREFIASLTGRMGLPALQIPVMRIPLDKRDGD